MPRCQCARYNPNHIAFALVAASRAIAVPLQGKDIMRFAFNAGRMLHLALAVILALSAPAAATAAFAANAPSAPPEAGVDLHATRQGDVDRVVVLYGDKNLTSGEVRGLREAVDDPGDIQVRRPDVVVVKTAKGRGRALAKRLRSLSGVAAAATVGTVRALETVPPNDVRYPFDQGAYVGQRAYMGPDAAYPFSTDIEPVWDAIFNTDRYAAEPDRAGVSVAVIDSGCTPPLMEDTGRIVPMWNYVDRNADTSDDFPVRHGTRVTGIIGAQADNAYGTAGALHATKSKLLIYKVLDSTGSGTSDDTMIAMMDAADDGAKIINASLGEPAVMDWPTSPYDATYDLSPDEALRAVWQSVVNYCSSKGAIVVAASGNYANDRLANGDTYTDVLYPAACAGTLAIGSINPLTGATSTFSGYGPELSVMAAGELVWTTSAAGTSSNSQPGTSYATPLVAGALATLWSLVPDVPAAQIGSFAKMSADASLEAPGYDVRTGFGRFDAGSMYQAMIAALPVQSTPASFSVSSGSGFETTLTWSPGNGTNVHYRYGYEGGPSYLTTATSGRLVLPSDGAHNVFVRAYADDRFDSLETTGSVVSLDTGMLPLSSARYEGLDRYETAAAISRSAYPTTAPALVIASGENWPDGLAAGVLAKTVSGPLLLTRTGSLPASIRDEIVRLKPQRVYLVGGRNAISSTTEGQIRALSGVSYAVERLAGADRYATAALIAGKVNALGGAHDRRAVIASGVRYADALAGSPLAARAGWPILLVKSDSVPAATTAALGQLGAASTVVLGGTSAIGVATVAQLPSPVRLFGSDRYATSRAIADYAHDLYGSPALGVTRGSEYPDALAAGPLLAASGAPLILANEFTPDLASWLGAWADEADHVVVLGGPGAIPYDLEFDILVTLRRPAEPDL